MSSYQGNIIIKNPATPTGPSPTGSAPGIWTLSEAMAFIKQGVWPTANYIVSDTYFPYVTMLLNSTAINAAQNSTFIDSSTNNLSITRNGNATQGSVSPYSANWSNYFPGTVGNYLTAPNDAAFQFGTGDVTIESWIYITGDSVASPDGNRHATICGAIGASGVSTDFWFYVKGNSTTTGTGLILRTYNSGTEIAVFNTTYAFSKNTWYHIALSRSGNNMYIFINGTLHASTTYTGAITAGSNPLNIGYAQTGSINYNSPFFGYISNLRIVKGSAVYTSAFTPPTSPLTAISGTSILTCHSNRLRDASANNFTITRTGDIRVSSFSGFSPSLAYSAATIGGSLYTDGSGDYLATSSSNALGFGSGDFTFECWLYPITYPNDSYMLSTGSTTTNNNISLEIRNAQVAAHLYISGSHSDVQFTDLQPRLYAWNHLAISRVSGVLYGFLNGVRSSVTQSLSASFGSSGLMSISQSGYSGYVSDVRISNGTAVYSGSTYTVPTAPLASTASTALLLKFTNAGIYDAAEINNMETIGNAQVSTAQSKFGGSSVYFDGTGDGIYFPSTISISSGDFTIECWYYTGSATNQSLCSIQTTSSSGYAAARVDFEGATSKIYMLISTSGSSWAINAGSSSTVSANTWTHIALVRSGSNFTLYINGTSAATGTSGSSLFSGTLNYVGCTNNGGITQSVNGYIDDLRITSGIARYTSNFTPPDKAFSAF